MRLTLNGRNIDITQALRDYVEEKIGRIVRHNDQIMKIEVTLGVTKNPSVQNNHYAEVSCILNGAKVHVQEEAQSMYASIDLLADKLDRQVKKQKEKAIKNKAGDSIRNSNVEVADSSDEDHSDDDIIEIEINTEEE